MPGLWESLFGRPSSPAPVKAVQKPMDKSTYDSLVQLKSKEGWDISDDADFATWEAKEAREAKGRLKKEEEKRRDEEEKRTVKSIEATQAEYNNALRAFVSEFNKIVHDLKIFFMSEKCSECGSELRTLILRTQKEDWSNGWPHSAQYIMFGMAGVIREIEEFAKKISDLGQKVGEPDEFLPIIREAKLRLDGKIKEQKTELEKWNRQCRNEWKRDEEKRLAINLRKHVKGYYPKQALREQCVFCGDRSGQFASIESELRSAWTQAYLNANCRLSQFGPDGPKFKVTNLVGPQLEQWVKEGRNAWFPETNKAQRPEWPPKSLLQTLGSRFGVQIR